ncbi:MAG: acyl-CoA dehydrogenase family protein [Myxococcales bacterium]|nr:acyl-CoA dehydrogenase family protein [Myxococcales bacterium]MDD9965361.1 acyl-CoA dehydrogenase family protein [Myxococcales bacterium]
MAIEFSFPPEIEDVRQRVREFMQEEVEKAETDDLWSSDNRRKLIETIFKLRAKAQERGLWLPHMPQEWGGMGLGPTAIAAVSSECARTRLGSFVLNCQAPDEGNMHTLLHFGTDAQKEEYLKPLCKGFKRSCFAMTEPEVAGSDPTLIQTLAERDGDDWVINGHKWFISGARGAHFAILIARTDPDAEVAQERNTAFIVDTESSGWNVVRDVETMSGSHNHCEIRIENLRVPHANILGRLGGGHELGQVRLGPARLAHCMRWIGQIEMALEMMIERARTRYSHGSYLSDKQGIQWMIADSGMELYAAKLMVLHAAYKIENKLDFKTEVSYAKHHVAQTLWKVIDRAVQVHGALGYSTDSPLSGMLAQARWARFADGADEIHQMRIAQQLIRAHERNGSVGSAVGDLPL